jgi:hypothetical protein
MPINPISSSCYMSQGRMRCCTQLSQHPACMGVYEEAAGQAATLACLLGRSLRAQLHDEALEDLHGWMERDNSRADCDIT